MFQGWDFLLGEIWVLIVLAALLGLFVGWLVWARRPPAGAGANDEEAGRLRTELEACQARARDCAQRVARLEDELSMARVASARPAAKAAPAAPAAPPAPAKAAPIPDPAPAPEPEPVAAVMPAPAGTGSKPATLDAPRDGHPDDLKRIKGIGPKLERLCNELGFWHYDQIANWSETEIAWVDANLGSFKGRVTRDNWVEQARELAAMQR